MRHIVLAAIALTSLIAASQTAFPHGEAIKVGGGAKGPVALSPAQAKALGLTLAKADFRPLDLVLKVNGTVALLPNSVADVSLRISGRVDQISAALGDKVGRDDKLAVVQSRAIGDPPPTVVVRAPRQGIVDFVGVAIGQSVEPDTRLFRISDRSRMRVIGKVYEEDSGQVKAGQKARVRVLAFRDKPIAGTVTLVGPNLDAETRTVEVWIDVDNAGNLLKPNMFAETDIVLSENAAALAVPADAVLEAGGEKFVFVRQGSKYDRVDIETGAFDDQFIEVASGLVPGDEVVVQGNRQIYTLWLTGGALKAEE